MEFYESKIRFASRSLRLYQPDHYSYVLFVNAV
jgi:hypothetical protein